MPSIFPLVYTSVSYDLKLDSLCTLASDDIQQLLQGLSQRGLEGSATTYGERALNSWGKIWAKAMGGRR